MPFAVGALSSRRPSRVYHSLEMAAGLLAVISLMPVGSSVDLSSVSHLVSSWKVIFSLAMGSVLKS